jgi:hypothetical protein
VPVAGDGVLDQRVGEEVEELSTGAEAAGPPEVEVVVDLAVSLWGVKTRSHS